MATDSRQPRVSPKQLEEAARHGVTFRTLTGQTALLVLEALALGPGTAAQVRRRVPTNANVVRVALENLAFAGLVAKAGNGDDAVYGIDAEGVKRLEAWFGSLARRGAEPARPATQQGSTN